MILVAVQLGRTERASSLGTLLEDAMKEAMPWAMALAMQKRLPSLVQLERLATQLIAIVAASQVDSPPAADVK